MEPSETRENLNKNMTLDFAKVKKKMEPMKQKC